jgi:spore germination protein GerM
MVKPRTSKVGLLVGLIIVLPFGLIGCPNDNSPPTPQTSSSLPSPSVSVTTTPSSEPPVSSQSNLPEAKADVYWLSSKGTKIELAPAKLALSNGSNPDAQLRTALERLLKGPANSDVTSSIPPETKLNSLKIENDGVHVDLSKAFISGGGSTAMQGRLGQVIYTASSLAPASPVWISVDGEPLKVLGGEGLEVSQPMTRTEFSKNFSL